MDQLPQVAWCCDIYIYIYICNGYIILKSNYFWDTLILASVPLFACAVSAAERDEEERVEWVCHTK